jgi:hypothetical protein
MGCSSCGSCNQVELPAEINVHLPGSEKRATPGIFAFPTLLICLDCGLTTFDLAETDLTTIRQGKGLVCAVLHN